MPNIFIETFPGRTIEEKRAAVVAITKAITEVWKVDKSVVNIRILENPKENVARGGVLFSDMGK